MKTIDEAAFFDTFQYFDKSIVLEIIDIFIREQPERMKAIKTGIQNKDLKTLKFDAHSLKGVVANFMAAKPEQIARELENKATAGDDSGLEALYASLEKASADLLDDLQELREKFIED